MKSANKNKVKAKHQLKEYKVEAKTNKHQNCYAIIEAKRTSTNLKICWNEADNVK